jgi:hypothetical protein
MRDETTGDLLCDVGATDTNFSYDEPNLNAVNIQIDFALDDNHRFKETVLWDLKDPDTLTPMLFATRTAETFGLSMKETLELAESIQRQLRDVVSERCKYSTAIPIKADMLGSLRDRPAPRLHSLYGDVIGPEPGGMLLCPSVKRPTHAPVRSTSVTKTQSNTKLPPKATNMIPKRKGPAKRSDAKIEECFKDEVQKRLLAESRRTIRESQNADTLGGELSLTRKSICHRCVAVKDTCGVFACRTAHHAYCDEHLDILHSIKLVSDVVPPILDYCPVCSLTCLCKACSRRLSQLGRQMRAKSLDQGTSPQATVFDDLLAESVALEATLVKEKAPRVHVKPQSSMIPGRKYSRNRIVTKLPACEFPKEVSFGKDIDPGSDVDYRTVFTGKGSYILESAGPQPVASVPTPTRSGIAAVEDGSVDHCVKCRQVGNLLCCDKCPRAYHPACIEDSEQPTNSDQVWDCPACRRENHYCPDDLLDGLTHLELIVSVYCDSSQDTSPIQNQLIQLRVLSIIYEMVLRLMEYDFGYIFRQPVDPIQVPGYLLLVKEPMDLGTITSKIVDGKYEVSGHRNLELIISGVLKDIELVWHNCFIFNAAGSAIYRMAEIQRAFARRIRETSLKNLLSKAVADDVESYVLSLESIRRHSATTAFAVNGNAVTASINNSSSPARHKVTVGKVSYKSRQIAILDPSTGLVIKMYNSIQAACAVVELFLGLKYDCEWDFSRYLNSSGIYQVLRQIIGDSSKYPDLLLFGYRWLLMDDLRRGRVAFPEEPVVSETADSNSGVKLDGAQNGRHSHEGTKDLKNEFKLDNISCVADTSSSKSVASPARATPGNTQQTRLLVYKEDLKSGIQLTDFDDVDAAYQDWLATLSSTLSSSPINTPDYFKAFYLDGDRSIDGIVWRTKQQPVSSQSVDEICVVNGEPQQVLRTEPWNKSTVGMAVSTGKRNADGSQMSATDMFSPLMNGYNGGHGNRNERNFMGTKLP